MQLPVLQMPVKIIPAILTVLGAIFSCTNYFRVILGGGGGKNGSTIAVSLLPLEYQSLWNIACPTVQTVCSLDNMLV